MSEANRIPVRLPESWEADWVLDRALGSGAFSTVYRAVRRDRPGVEAAIKVISIPGSDAEAAALQSEGLNASQSQSYFDAIAQEYISEIDLMEDLKGFSHIVSIEDYKLVRKPDRIGNDIFIRMELLIPLDSIIRQESLSEREVIHLGIDICSALELCEQKKIIHRDIKPANIFVNARTAQRVFYKLGDFGVARSLEAVTQELSKKGTPNYMAPEVFFGKPYDHRADIYSLGITMYRLLNNNRLPLIAAHDLSPAAREAAMSRRLSGEKLPPPEEGSTELQKVILKACEYKPGDRYAHAADMKAALEALLANDGTEVLPENKKDHKKLISIAALAVCAILGIAAGAVLLLRPEPIPNPVLTATPTEILSPELTATPSLEPTAAPSSEPEPTSSPTPEMTPTPSPEPTPTPSPVPTATPSPEPTLTPSPEPTPSPSPVPTPTPSPEPTPSPTPEPTPTPSPVPTPTPSPEPTPSPTPEPTPTPSPVPTPTPSPEPTPSPTPEPTKVPIEDLTIPLNIMLNRFGTPVVFSANMWESSSENSKLLLQLREGDEVYLIENQLDEKGIAWTKVLAFDMEGYVRTEFLQLLPSWENREIMQRRGTMPVYTSAPLPSATPGITVRKGNTVILGKFEQDNVKSNGTEPIEWIVLSVNQSEGTATLISKYILDCQVYHKKAVKVDWQNSSLHDWLNSSFLDGAFSPEEKNAIVPTYIGDYPDQVFMLNAQQINTLLSSELCEATTYAKKRGVYVAKDVTTSSWWVRTDYATKMVDFVGAHGKIYKDGNIVTMKDNGVRPAITLSLAYLAGYTP